MQIKLKVYSILREVFESSSIVVEIAEEGILADLITELEKEYGNAFLLKTGRNLAQDLKDRFDLFLSRQRIRLPEDLRLKLKNNDEIVILQPVGGG
jgi:molybdopterin converting factor small subunit